jgi:hypothetical protein
MTTSSDEDRDPLVRCALCLAIFGGRAPYADTLVQGTAVCADHVSYLLDAGLVRLVREDAGL